MERSNKAPLLAHTGQDASTRQMLVTSHLHACATHPAPQVPVMCTPQGACGMHRWRNACVDTRSTCNIRNRSTSVERCRLCRGATRSDRRRRASSPRRRTRRTNLQECAMRVHAQRGNGQSKVRARRTRAQTERARAAPARVTASRTECTNKRSSTHRARARFACTPPAHRTSTHRTRWARAAGQERGRGRNAALSSCFR